MPQQPRQLISFDWALKRVLRSKANHTVLEGFLTELLGEPITITDILESESNRDTAADRSNRVDLIVRDSRDRRVLIEVQYAREGDYFHRMVYGASKAVAESLDSGQRYGKVVRVISVNIVYFDLGQGKDYVYAGQTEFRGVHGNDRLELSTDQRQLFTAETVAELFPQFYILKVNNFNAVAKNGLDEWIQFLKTGKIASGCQARGLREAQSVLDLLKLSAAERAAYDAYIKEQRIAAGVAESTLLRAEKAEHDRDDERRQKEEERQRADEERRQKEEERQRADEERRQKERLLKKAIAALIASGLDEQTARNLLESSL